MFLFDCRRPRMETHLQIEAFDDAGAVAIILVPTAGSHLVHVVVVVFYCYWNAMFEVAGVQEEEEGEDDVQEDGSRAQKERSWRE